MSHAPVIVRFPDGSIRYGCYTGTSDQVFGELIEDAGDWFSLREWPRPITDPAPEAEPVPVQIWAGYGSNHHWSGTATPHRVVTGHSPYGDGWTTEDAPDLEDGNPQWVIDLITPDHPLHAFLR